MPSRKGWPLLLGLPITDGRGGFDVALPVAHVLSVLVDLSFQPYAHNGNAGHSSTSC